MSVRQMPLTAAATTASDSSPGTPMSPYAEFGLRVAERFGVPTVLLVAVGWWVQSGVVQPLLNAHFDVVGKIVAGQQKHTEELNAIGDQLDELIMVSRDAAKASKTQ